MLALHERLLTLHGGAVGLRDAGLLESALAQPQQLYAYADVADRFGFRLDLSYWDSTPHCRSSNPLKKLCKDPLNPSFDMASTSSATSSLTSPTTSTAFSGL